MKGPSPRRLWKYVTQRLRLGWYFQTPGDGRVQPQIPARTLLWAWLLGQILREWSFLAVEALVRSAPRALSLSRSFSDDTLAYFSERLQVQPLRQVLAQLVRQAKRNKAFQETPFMGLSLDGSTVGRCAEPHCPLCRPYRNAAHQIIGFRHHLVLLSVVGAGLSLPVDVEPYGPGDSEYAAGQRLLRRARAGLGARGADYVVVDSEYATAPFLHEVGDGGWHVVARLKSNLPELFQAAQRRFRSQPPRLHFRDGQDRVELWDADDFDPWEALCWTTVRVIFYRQHKPNGEVVEAYWLTDFSSRRISGPTLYRLAKSRWEIENQGFNDAKNRHGLEHLCHHEAHSLLVSWLMVLLGLSIERLYRLRYAHRGTHRVWTAMEWLRLFQFNLRRLVIDTS